MIVIPGRIPVVIHPFFWVIAALIGWMNSASFLGMFLWVGIIFFSVLIHEFGHALTALAFKQTVGIQLVAMGGLTSFQGPKLKFWQQFIITFNGPLFGFFLFLGASFLLQFDLSSWPLSKMVLKMTQVANLFWTIVNLLPVLPLDGGQLLRIVLEAIFGIKGFRASLFIGSVLSILLSFYFFMIQAFLVGAIFFLFAFQSFDSWRKSRAAVSSDREEENRELLLSAETLLQEGKKQEGKALLETLVRKTKGGLLYAAAAQYLAVFFMEEGKHREAYDLLLPIEEHLADDTKCLLHRLGAEFQNDPLVARLSKECYQTKPTKETALRNARAFARLKEPKMAGGWLQTAWSYGNVDVASLLKEPCFVPLRGDLEFEAFVEKMV